MELLLVLAVVTAALLARRRARRSADARRARSASARSLPQPLDQRVLERPSGPLAIEAPRTRHAERQAERERADVERNRVRFAQAGASGPLFDYPVDPGQPGEEHRGLFAVLDLETTGLRPEEGDRVVEVAVALVRADGTVVDEFATLVHPGRNGVAGSVDTGPVHIHGITPEHVAGAPTFGQVAPELLRRLDGAVVVAHNAHFEERFLVHELARAGYEGLRLRGACTLLWARQSMTTPDHRLATVVAAAGIPFPAQHTALGDVRVTAALLPSLLAARGGQVAFATAPPGPLPVPASDLGAGWRPVTRTP